MRIAFRLIDSRIWQGGFNYLRNLCCTLIESEGIEIQPVVFHGTELPKEDIASFHEIDGLEMMPNDLFARGSLQARQRMALLTGKNSESQAAFEKQNIDLVFANADFYGRNFGIPVMSWIPDFQHRHLRHMFSKWRYWKREVGFRKQLKHSQRIMVSSHDARRDCQDFYGTPESKISVVQFAIPYTGQPDAAKREQTRKKYDLPKKFYILPNQFWKHKNHALVIQALQKLSNSDFDITIAVTGGATNPTCVQVLEDTRREVEQFGLQSSFRLLGKIPYGDLICLLTDARALINPSQFEGWSTTIEEAKSYGVNMILSSLHVHREQVGESGIFFDPDNADSLVEALRTADKTLSGKRMDEEALIEQSKNRMATFAADFREAACIATGS